MSPVNEVQAGGCQIEDSGPCSYEHIEVMLDYHLPVSTLTPSLEESWDGGSTEASFKLEYT